MFTYGKAEVINRFFNAFLLNQNTLLSISPRVHVFKLHREKTKTQWNIFARMVKWKTKKATKIKDSD